MSALAGRLGVSAASVTGVAKRLAGVGIVDRSGRHRDGQCNALSTFAPKDLSRRTRSARTNARLGRSSEPAPSSVHPNTSSWVDEQTPLHDDRRRCIFALMQIIIKSNLK